MHADGRRIADLIERISRETGARVPGIYPRGPGPNAQVVMVMLTPGPAVGGAQQTNVLSPTMNSDQSALNLQQLMAEAYLSESVCVFWNAIPWALDVRREPTAQELRLGVSYLREFAALLPKRRAVVALGEVAQRACRMANIEAIEVPSPSPLSVAAPGAVLNTKSRRWITLRTGLARAAELANQESIDPAPGARGLVDDCGTCRANRGELRAPGGVIYEDRLWRVEHKLEPVQIAGWLIAKPLRHVTAFADLTAEEAEAFGPLIRRVMSALTAVVAPTKVYLLLLAEQKDFEHIHFHLIPRADSVPERYRGPKILHYDAKPTWTEAEAVAVEIRKALPA